MKRMRNILFIVFFFTFISVVTPSVHAQDVGAGLDKMIGGLDCGMAQAEGGMDKCCYQAPLNFQLPFQSALSNVPSGGAISILDQQAKSFQNLQDKYAAKSACIYGSPSTAISDPSCKCMLLEKADAIPQFAAMCQKYFGTNNSKELKVCQNCANGGGMWSGMGCIPLTLQNFITNFLLSFGIGLGGLIALGCIIYSAITIQTSQGNPEKLKKAQENITSCIIGLIFIIFSVFLLRVIGVDLLGIPGFGF